MKGFLCVELWMGSPPMLRPVWHPASWAVSFSLCKICSLRVVASMNIGSFCSRSVSPRGFSRYFHRQSCKFHFSSRRLLISQVNQQVQLDIWGEVTYVIQIFEFQPSVDQETQTRDSLRETSGWLEQGAWDSLLPRLTTLSNALRITFANIVYILDVFLFISFLVIMMKS